MEDNHFLMDHCHIQMDKTHIVHISKETPGISGIRRGFYRRLIFKYEILINNRRYALSAARNSRGETPSSCLNSLEK